MAGSPHINGIYYDGILFDRLTMQRVRKTLERNSDPAFPPLIDMHTGNATNLSVLSSYCLQLCAQSIFMLFSVLKLMFAR